MMEAPSSAASTERVSARIRPYKVARGADTNDKAAIGNLQVLRVLAAAMVLFGHVQEELFQSVLTAEDGFHEIRPVWWPGGVDVFFVISGFIMYHIARRQFGVPGLAKRFLFKRLVRIAPPYWFFTTLLLAVMLVRPGYVAHSALEPWHVIASYLFWPTYSPTGELLPLLITGWTLSFELLFYGIFSLGMLLPLRRGMALIVLMLSAVAAAVALDFQSAALRFWCNPIVLEFLFGIGIAELRRRGLRLAPLTSIACCALAVAAMVLLQTAGVTGNYWNYRFLWMGAPSALLCAALALAPDPPAPSPWYRLLVSGGDASYSLYLSHPFALGAGAVILRGVGLSNPWLYLLGSLLVAMVAAMVIYRVLEHPFHRWLEPRLALRLAAALALMLGVSCSSKAPPRAATTPSVATLPLVQPAESLLADRLTLLAPDGVAPDQCEQLGSARPGRQLSLSKTFVDGFAATELDSRVWTPHLSGDYTWVDGTRTLSGNKEQQIYVDPLYPGRLNHTGKTLGLNPFEIKDGTLFVIARQTPLLLAPALANFPYYSGAITTFDSFRQRFGYFEVRAKLPEGHALWPAFWLLKPKHGDWPPEIDIMEQLGHDPNTIYTTAHRKPADSSHAKSNCHTTVVKAARSFHSYGVLVEPDRITWFVDRAAFAQIATKPQFDVELYLIINLAVGGTWPGPVSADTPAEARLAVDHVVAYQLDGQPR